MAHVIHANALDGRVHEHQCPDHAASGGGEAGLDPQGQRISDACFFEEEHGPAHRAAHRAKAIAALTAQAAAEPNPANRARVQAALAMVEAV